MTPEKALADALEEKMSDEILRMIETVDLADTAKLAEIDARVHFLLDHENCEGNKFAEFYDGVTYYYSRLDSKKYPLSREWAPPKYTRSRDALKAIRPEGWMIHDYCLLGTGCPEYGSPLEYQWALQGKTTRVTSPKLPTEELAELHAIIQAIEYERARSALQVKS